LILEKAVHSRFVPEIYADHESWHNQLSASPAIIQWDPDHDPLGNKVGRKTIQIGLRNDFISNYARSWVLEIEDISTFVAEQRKYVDPLNYHALLTPSETSYPLNSALQSKLFLSPNFTPPQAKDLEDSSQNQSRQI